MESSIAYFYEVSTKVFEKLIREFYKNPTDFASFVTGIDQELHQFGIRLLKETLDDYAPSLLYSLEKQGVRHH